MLTQTTSGPVSAVWSCATAAHFWHWARKSLDKLDPRRHLLCPLIIYSDVVQLCRALQDVLKHYSAAQEGVHHHFTQVYLPTWIAELTMIGDKALERVATNTRRSATSFWSQITHNHWRCSRSTSPNDEMAEVVEQLLVPAALATRWLPSDMRQILLQRMITESLEALGHDIVQRRCSMNHAVR